MDKQEKFRLVKIGYLNLMMLLVFTMIVVCVCWLLFVHLCAYQLPYATRFVEIIASVFGVPVMAFWTYEIHCLLRKKPIFKNKEKDTK